jgi:hypothetical protein
MFSCNDDFYNDDNNLSSLLLLTPYDRTFFLTKYFLRIMFSEIINKLCPLRSIFLKIILRPVIRMCVELYFCFSMAQQPLVGQGLLIFEALRSHPVTSR